MAEAFDPYHKWLGISPKDQPPNHYRLLGIELFESDPDVVEGAADQRMSHVRTFQTGQNSALSQRILNELSAAKLCLLDASRRAEYDRQLKAKLQEAATANEPQLPPAAPAPRPLPQAKALPVQEPAPIVISDSASPVSVIHKRATRKSPAWRQPAVLAGAGVAVLALGAAIYIFSSGPKTNVAQANRASAAAEKIKRDVVKLAPQRPKPAKPIKAAATTSASPNPSEASPASVNADFEIIDASWGASDARVNVSDVLRQHVKNNRLVMMAWASLLGSPEDPAKGVEKKLRIQYRARGRVYAVECPEFFFVYLDGNPLAPPTDASDGLELLEARYGAGDTYLDVLPQARERIRDGRFSVAEDEFYNKDVVPEGWEAGGWAGAFKVLWVRYRNATGEHFAYAWNSQPLTIDCRTPQTAGPPIDLLKLVDVQRDAVQGEWRLDDKGLAAPGGMYDRLWFPADLPDEYVLTLVAEADDELRDVSTGLVIDGRQVTCCLDGGNGLSSGLNLVDDAWFNQPDKNPTFSWRMARLLEQGRPNTLTCIVRKTSLRVLRDGAEVVRWSGDPQTLTVPAHFHVADSQKLWIQSYDMPFRVTKAELAPLEPAKSEMLVHPEPNQPVDLLAGIDLERDMVRGEWRLDGASLVSPGEDPGLLQLPAVLPENYRLEVVAARESGNDHFSFTLPVGGAQTTLIVDAYEGKLSGLQTIDGKKIKLAGENETRREASIFADGQPKPIVVTVRKNRVQMVCDGQPLVDWAGDVSRLGPNEKLPYKDRIYLGGWYSRYRITKAVLTPLSAEPETEPSAVLAGKPIDLLKQIDPKRDAVAGDWQLIDGVLVSPDAPFSRLMLPAPPSPEYQLTVVAERVKGDWGLATGLVIDGRQVMAGIDCFDGYHAGLELLDGKSSNDNESTLKGRLLVDGRPSTLVYTARRDGVEVTLDGRTVIDWHGDPNRLSMIEDWKIPDPARLSLNTFKTVCRISKIELAPLVENPSAKPAAPAQVVAAGDSSRPRNLGDLVAAKESRLPPPDEATEKKARQEVRKTFAADFAAAKTPAEKRKLAEKFVKLAGETQDDGASVYVLLREAVELGEAAGDLDLVWEAIDELARSHAIDAIGLKQHSLTESGKAAKSPQQAREMADDACRLMAEALAAGQQAAVKKVAAQAQSFAKRTKDAALIKEIGIRARDAGKLAGEFEQATAARETLKTRPDDPDANFALGRYEACAAGDWKQALPKLAKGGDASWRKLAQDDLDMARDPATPQRQIAAGDGWWTLAEKEAWPGRHYLQKRAAEWYRRAQPSLAAKDKARVDERLGSLLAEDDGLPAWELFDLRGGQRRGGYVRLLEGGALTTSVEYEGPIDVSFVARTDSLNIRLFAHGHDEAVIWNWEVNPQELRVVRPTGDATGGKVAPLEANRWYALRYVVTPQGITISVDGAIVFAERKNYPKMPRSHIRIYGSQGSIVDVKKLVVKPLD
ncbi:MAG TPA: hypothetical protein VN699_20040 [Pirellulales bacterium]|nr:hypothetical protein [Pirellulales bacterium]